jgi:hypothetical protein
MLNFNEEHLEQLILEGIVEFAGLDKDGEMLYSFTPDLETKAPAIHRIVQDLHMQDIYYLWEQGYLQMDITKSNPLVTPTVKALDEEAVDQLPPYLKILIEQIKEEMRRER